MAGPFLARLQELEPLRLFCETGRDFLILKRFEFPAQSEIDLPSQLRRELEKRSALENDGAPLDCFALVYSLELLHRELLRLSLLRVGGELEFEPEEGALHNAPHVFSAENDGCPFEHERGSHRKHHQVLCALLRPLEVVGRHHHRLLEVLLRFLQEGEEELALGAGEQTEGLVEDEDGALAGECKRNRLQA